MKGLGSLYVRNTNSPVEGKQQCLNSSACQEPGEGIHSRRKGRETRVNSIKYSIIKGIGQGTVRHPEIKKD